ncbi:helix-turn-helix domain-containing protein [Macrococcus brunensis]|uniref:helix-turn-helix domain-containing protein n=1 Tax=Macrococcus brunensis TaxID=198483 RepID=UPI001EF0CE43|nr:helix-turn-helix transcriptional regulator [Macrococcus brunensis]ULG71923.1 helix-turn-helix transcriptional regulator [Macrococcus brunensis]
MIKTNLSILMAERGYKIAELHEATGISKTTLMALADNTGKGLQFDTVDKLCNFLGVTPCEFFGYAPYLISIIEEEDEDKDFSFHITIKNKFYEKTFYFGKAFSIAGDEFFPIEDKSFSFTCRVYLMQTDTYEDEEFYSFLSDLSVSFYTEFINDLLKVVRQFAEHYLEQKVIKSYAPFSSSLKDYPVKKGDKILVHLFPHTKHEAVKTITL